MFRTHTSTCCDFLKFFNFRWEIFQFFLNFFMKIKLPDFFCFLQNNLIPQLKQSKCAAGSSLIVKKKPPKFKILFLSIQSYLRSTISQVEAFFSTPRRLLTMQKNNLMTSTVALLNLSVSVLSSKMVLARWLKSFISWLLHHTSSRSRGFPLTVQLISASVPLLTMATFVIFTIVASSIRAKAKRKYQPLIIHTRIFSPPSF